MEKKELIKAKKAIIMLPTRPKTATLISKYSNLVINANVDRSLNSAFRRTSTVYDCDDNMDYNKGK